MKLLFGNHGEVEFVMHLKYHFRLQSLCLEALVDAHHSYLDDVCRGALDRRIDGISLCYGADCAVARRVVWLVAATMIQRLGVAFLGCRLLAFLHKGVDAGESGEVAVYQCFSFAAVNAHILCQTKDRYAIDDAEISSLCL